jgi:hypothetical protein
MIKRKTRKGFIMITHNSHNPNRLRWGRRVSGTPGDRCRLYALGPILVFIYSR